MSPVILLTLAVAVADADAGFDDEADAGEVDAGFFEGDAGEPAPAPEVVADDLMTPDAGEGVDPDTELGEEPLPPEPAPVVVEAPYRGPLSVAVIHALAGRFAASTCTEPLTESPFERLSARVSALPPGTLRFDAGDLLGASAIGRFAVQQDLESLARSIRDLGLAGRALAHRDFASTRPHLLAFTRALSEQGLRTTLTNLSCTGDAVALCDAVINGAEEPLLVDAPVGKVGFIAALSPQAMTGVSKDLSSGVKLEPPAEALADATRRARALGATRVVAVYDPAIGDELPDTLALVRALDAAALPDVLVIDAQLEPLRSAMVGGAGLPLIATRPGEALVIELRYDGTLRVEPAEPKSAPDSVVAFSQSLNRELCDLYQEPFPRGLLGQPLTRDEAAALVLDVMREYARAEVAVINGPAISAAAPWPLETPLTHLALFQALPFDNRMRVVTVTGAALAEFLDSGEAKSAFIRGAKKDGAWKVNGRALEPTQTYRVVTTDFVAERFGGIFEEAEALGSTIVRDLLRDWLSVKKPGPLLSQPIDPAERARWWFSYRLQLDLTSVSVSNPNQSVFQDTQLLRGQSLSLVGETEARAIGDHPLYAFEHQARLRYGVVDTTALDGTTTGAVNNVDLLTARTLAFGRKVFGSAAWYVPRPYADVFVESELTRPETRRYHHLQLLPTAGVRFELLSQFAVYVGAGATWEVFAQREDLNPQVPPAAFVLVAGWQLRPLKIIKLGQRWLEAETNLDYWVRDLGGPTQSQARARARLVVPLFSVLSLTATYDLFFRSVRSRDAEGAWQVLYGVSNDVYVGLQVAFGRAFQSFTF
ncbi:MAG: 5'-nucleotidase C-terminal domain-containing protein [Myxococcaceae bacterium]|nr:5'-nucleotidase C-terminal domain-containing protein [Myxococcaceae bacterium]